MKVKMIVLKLLFIFFLNYQLRSTFGERTCDDCILFDYCEDASAFYEKHGKSSTSERMFKQAYCGYQYKKGRKTPKFCCSEFKEKDAIESHSNLKLLPDTCVNNIDEVRIIGGTDVGIYELPWMTLLSYRIANGLQFLCGGSIISERYILTAAHCVLNKNIIGVRVGEHNIQTKRDCEGVPPNLICETHKQDLYVEETIVHEDYSLPPVTKHDIALLRLRRPIDFSHRNVKPVCLPVAKELRKPLNDGERGVVAGWGVTETDPGFSVLLKVNIPLYTNSTCNKNYYNGINSHNNSVGLEFCAGEEKKDSCGGDSGGPFIIEREYKSIYSYIQYGIVSRGPIKCGSSSPGIYTNVIEYMEWILDHIKA